jgi:hypothetical protein
MPFYSLAFEVNSRIDFKVGNLKLVPCLYIRIDYVSNNTVQ